MKLVSNSKNMEEKEHLRFKAYWIQKDEVQSMKAGAFQYDMDYSVCTNVFNPFYVSNLHVVAD